jgi:hypothetical protein
VNKLRRITLSVVASLLLTASLAGSVGAANSANSAMPASGTHSMLATQMLPTQRRVEGRQKFALYYEYSQGRIWVCQSLGLGYRVCYALTD